MTFVVMATAMMLVEGEELTMLDSGVSLLPSLTLSLDIASLFPLVQSKRSSDVRRNVVQRHAVETTFLLISITYSAKVVSSAVDLTPVVSEDMLYLTLSC